MCNFFFLKSALVAIILVTRKFLSQLGIYRYNIAFVTNLLTEKNKHKKTSKKFTCIVAIDVAEEVLL